MKTLVAAVLALAGAVAAGYGAFQPWQHGRTGAHTPLSEVLSAPSRTTASPATSAFLLIVIGLVLLVLGLVRKSSVPMFLGGVLVLLPVALPLVLGNLKFDDLQAGAWQVLCGGALAIVAAGLRS